jgi:hypothetical protein
MELFFMSLFHESGIKEQELETGLELRHAMQVSRKFRPAKRTYFRQLLEALDSNPDILSAVSPRSRIRWGKLICEALSDHFHLGSDKLEPDQRIFFVTLCDRRCCTPDDAKNIDVPGFISLLVQGLQGLSYLGMLEPAYYVNVCDGLRIYGKRMVSWHVHLLAWGETREEMKKRIERLNREFLLPIADGLAAGHQKCISKGRLASKIAYMLKAPQNGYRLAKINWVMPGGEIVPKFKQFKSKLRPGERLTLFQLMKDMRLDELAVAGGEGEDILRRVKRRLLRDLPKSHPTISR